MSNPFTDAYDALWDCLEASSSFTARVRGAQRIKMTESGAGTDRDPYSRLKNVRSFPSVAIIPTSKPESESRIQADSDTTDVEKWFAVLIGTGDQRVDDIFDMEFVILRAFSSWRDTVGAVQWESEDCVLDCSLFDHTEEMDRKLIEQGVRGWSTVWLGRLWFYFADTNLADSSSSGAD